MMTALFKRRANDLDFRKAAPLFRKAALFATRYAKAATPLLSILATGCAGGYTPIPAYVHGRPGSPYANKEFKVPTDQCNDSRYASRTIAKCDIHYDTAGKPTNVTTGNGVAIVPGDAHAIVQDVEGGVQAGASVGVAIGENRLASAAQQQAQQTVQQTIGSESFYSQTTETVVGKNNGFVGVAPYVSSGLGGPTP